MLDCGDNDTEKEEKESRVFWRLAFLEFGFVESPYLGL